MLKFFRFSLLISLTVVWTPIGFADSSTKASKPTPRIQPIQQSKEFVLQGFVRFPKDNKKEIHLKSGFGQTYRLRRQPVFLRNQATLKKSKPQRQVSLRIKHSDILGVSRAPASRPGGVR